MEEDERVRLGRLRENLTQRSLIIDTIRSFFKERGFLEVETPIRAPAIAPEPYLDPFTSEGHFLITSPELHMKRLLAAGYGKIFQFSRCFRKGERGRWHNPEFTMLEWYRAGADYHTILGDIEQLFQALSENLFHRTSITYQGNVIDLYPPWPRLTIREACLKYAGWDPVASFDARRFDTDMVAKLQPSLDIHRPTILLDYPAAQAALARLKPSDMAVAERAEIFIGGLELANAYSELTDPAEQEKRFQEAIAEIKREGRKPPDISRPFLEALPHLPPSGGVALGVDRLVMLFCDAASIDEVIAFTEETA